MLSEWTIPNIALFILMLPLLVTLGALLATILLVLFAAAVGLIWMTMDFMLKPIAWVINKFCNRIYERRARKEKESLDKWCKNNQKETADNKGDPDDSSNK